MRRTAAWAAAVLAAGSAAVSAYWTAGGTALLDTVGGAVERLARERGGVALAVGAGVVVAKLVAALLALTVAYRPTRPLRVLALLGAALLVLWGGANVVLGGAVLTGLLDLGAVADPRALRWHVLCWDAWFLLWGLALMVAATADQRGGAVDARSTSTGATNSLRSPG